MRSSRLLKALITALAATAIAAAPLMAQGDANWDLRPNSWYWGMYGGKSSFATTVARTSAPLFGVEWMVTRKNFAMNVFAEQSYFNAVSTISDPSTGAPRNVDIQDMRRVGGSGMIFLPQYKYFHPWFGAGYAFNYIRKATPQGPAGSNTIDQPTRDSLQSAQAQGKVFGELGMMVSYKQWAPFVQYTIMPSKGTSNWFVNGDGFSNFLKVGFRYSFGPAFTERW